jgi:hypothetical protein
MSSRTGTTFSRLGNYYDSHQISEHKSTSSIIRMLINHTKKYRLVFDDRDITFDCQSWDARRLR